jgi:hypothetical protein
MTMKARNVTIFAAALCLMLFTGQESALSQSNCTPAKGQQDGVFDSSTNTTTGEITRGGWLDGTTLDAFHGAVLPTPDPTTVSFTGDFTLTTIHGELKASNVYIFNFVTGNAAVLAHIDPTTSTGTFAGATGILYFAGKTISFSPFVTQAKVSGEVCFAK